MVTDFIRDFTGIADEVTFVGRADHFQLWQPQAFLAAQAQARGERRLAGRRS
jgi:MraZ protein